MLDIAKEASNTTKAQLLLRWPRGVVQLQFSLSSGVPWRGFLSLVHFS